MTLVLSGHIARCGSESYGNQRFIQELLDKTFPIPPSEGEEFKTYVFF